MNNVDENTKVAIEIMEQGAKISEELILKIMQKITNLLSKDNKEKYILKDTSKEGQQKINDLIKKHKDGVLALDENITKQQLNDYKEELKKLGVDFSVVKNEKDSYSFFFASQQASVIEKALKNIVERKNNVLENEQVKKLEKDLKNAKQDLPKDKTLEVKKLYDKISTSEDKKPKENNITYSRLSKQEKLFYSKLEELDEIKRNLYSQEVDRVENLFANRYKQNENIKAGNKSNLIENDTSKERTKTNFKDGKDQVEYMLNSLSIDEQKLMIQYTNVMTENLDNFYADKSSYIQSKKLVEMKENFTPEQIEKVNTVVNQNIHSSNTNEEVNGKIHVDDFHSILKEIKEERTQEKVKKETKENKVEFSMNGVKEIDKKIKEESKGQDKSKNKKQVVER